MWSAKLLLSLLLLHITGSFGTPHGTPKECPHCLDAACRTGETYTTITQNILFNSQQRLLYRNYINPNTRLPIMSGSFINSDNFKHGRSVPTDVSKWLPVVIEGCIAENQQPYCRTDYPQGSPQTYDFLINKGRERSFLTQAYGNQFGTVSLDALHTCINTIPQDKAMNYMAWADIERLAYDITRLSSESFVITGSCAGDLGNPSPLGEGALPIPECMWKLVCLPASDGGLPYVGGWVANNTEPAYTQCNENKTMLSKKVQSFQTVISRSGRVEEEVMELFADIQRDVGRSCWRVDGQHRMLPDVRPQGECVRNVDETKQPFGHGDEVRDAVHYMVTRAKTGAGSVFNRDYDTLFRLFILIQDRFNEENTYFSQFKFGGVYQITESHFQATKSAPTDVLSAIKTAFNIDWSQVVYEDCLKPIYSALAAAIRFHVEAVKYNKPFTVEKSVAVISQIWPQVLVGDTSTAVQTIRNFYANNPTRGVFDLVVILDGSGSIGPTDFDVAKRAVANLLFSLKNESPAIQAGLVLYSTEVTTSIQLNANKTANELKIMAQALQYPDGGTETALAIDRGVALFQTQSIPGRPRVVILLTDGQSNNKAETILSARRSAAENILTFSIGIKKNVNLEELTAIAGDDPGHVFQLDSYQDLAEMPLWLNRYAKLVPRVPTFNSSFSDAMQSGDTHYFKIPLPENGVTIEVKDVSGTTQRFYSFNFDIPSAVIHDGEIGEGLIHIVPEGGSQTLEEKFLYVSIQGKDAGRNEYEVVFHEGLFKNCGFRDISGSYVVADPVQPDQQPGAILWEGRPYGYEDSKSGRNVFDYVELEMEEERFLIVTTPKFPDYREETGQNSMNVSVSFRCADNSRKIYNINIPLLD